jgi:transposase
MLRAYAALLGSSPSMIISNPVKSSPNTPRCQTTEQGRETQTPRHENKLNRNRNESCRTGLALFRARKFRCTAFRSTRGVQNHLGLQSSCCHVIVTGTTAPEPLLLVWEGLHMICRVKPPP